MAENFPYQAVQPMPSRRVDNDMTVLEQIQSDVTSFGKAQTQ